jgi:CBS-domain-containing membrane protein
MHIESQARVGDVMTREVATVSPATPFKQIAAEISERRVSALPVVGADGRVLGVVSEADLLRREEHADPQGTRFVLNPRRRRAELAKAQALTAGELMSAPAITVEVGTTLAEAARLMRKRGVKRLVVVDAAGRLAGIVSRGDVIRVFLRPDQEIQDAALNGLAKRVLWLETTDLQAHVAAGVVTLTGRLDRRSDTRLLAELTADVDGVIGVVSKLTYNWDDTRRTSHVPEPSGPFWPARMFRA